MRKPILIGQAPSRLSDPSKPLEGRPSAFLAKLLGWSMPDFLSTFDRVNLVNRFEGKVGKGDLFDKAKGRAAATKMLAAGDLNDRRVVFLGKEVAACFGVNAAFLEWCSHTETNPPFIFMVVVPHPSGINLWWNEGANRRMAIATLREAAR